MVRSPSSLKQNASVLKRGPWTSDEDQILTEHIKLHGHPNWRALPRLAGLARCGKSCRLRWTNYLQPGIKRGNFSREEEETIINLHQLLGNRWSAIAAKLPGRTDNEIKNVWHTHLKKKLLDKNENQQQQEFQESTTDEPSNNEADFILVDESIFNQSPRDQNTPLEHADDDHVTENINSNNITPCKNNSNPCAPFSPQEGSHQSEGSFDNYEAVPSPEDFPETDESFWSDVLSYDDVNNSGSGSSMDTSCYQPVMLVSDVNMETDSNHSSNGQYESQSSFTGSSIDVCDVDDFWFDVLFKAGEHPAFLNM